MRSLPVRPEKFARSAWRAGDHGDRSYRLMLIASLLVLTSISFACTSNRNNANSGPKTTANSNATAEPRTASSQSATINIKEPDRYSVAMTISAQEAATTAPVAMLTQQFGFTRFDSDRRWAFVLPAPLGPVVYLEKSGLKYLVLFERKQYVELAPDAFGFRISDLTPGALAEQLKSSVRYEQLGLEPVNGRTAIKYRLTSTGDAQTHTDGLIFVDQETGLPLRSELTIGPEATKRRVIVEARDIQLNPDRAQFDVPAGMKKITAQEAKQQIEVCAGALRPFANIIRGSPTTPTANATQPAGNKNAGRRGK